jgi:prepilin-type N-terminal cleavage/methylation domain-containing protein
MNIKILSQTKERKKVLVGRGFTLIELLVGSTVMLVVIIATLTLYMRSNKVAVDQNMMAELQQDVRSAMYFITRDVRMAGVGLPPEFSQYYFEGTDNEDQLSGSVVRPDRFLMMGNIVDPLNLKIEDYQGSSENAAIMDFSFEQYPYPDEFYDNKIVLLLPNPSSGCSEMRFRSISEVVHNSGGTNEKLGFAPGQAPGINPPGGLGEVCPDPDDYDGGMICFINVIEYWLDVTGNYTGLTAGLDGYVGEPGILYMTLNGLHYPLAQNVENLQFEYNGDINSDTYLDGFCAWNHDLEGNVVSWTFDQITSIRQVRILVLGRTPRPFVSVSGRVPQNLYLYQRPALSNDPSGLGEPDRHKRFLLESTSNIRNMSLNLYNTGTR